MSSPTVTLNDGFEMPQLGFGVFRIPPPETAAAVGSALEAGYRSIDTAAAYGNEEGVGEAVARSALPRNELFVTTKLWNADQGHPTATQACHRSLERLGLDYIDLYLIHWPVPQQDKYVETWQALLALRNDGLVRSVGVSNFEPEHLRRLQDETGELPAVNQVELHPWLQQAEVRAVCDELSVMVEAWAPLAEARLLQEPTITAIAERLGRTPAQVVLRWHIQLGNVAIPKTVRPERMRENLDVFGFELSAADMEAIGGLDRTRRLGPDPNTFTG